jgi:hypothetical protein
MKTLLGVALMSTFLFIATSSHACLRGHNRHNKHHGHHSHRHHFLKEHCRKNLENMCKVLNETENEIIMSCPKALLKKNGTNILIIVTCANTLVIGEIYIDKFLKN